MVKSLRPGSGDSYPFRLSDVGGALFFTARDGTHGRELWTSDGTEAGTVLVEDLYRGAEGSNPEWITDVGGKVFLSATSRATGRELWMLAPG